MGYPPDDLELDNGYWQSLLKDVEKWDSERPTAAANKAADNEVPVVDRRYDTHYEPPPVQSRPSVADASARMRGPEPPSEELWDMLRDAMDRETILEVEVTGYNRGGLIVRYHTLRGFVPHGFAYWEDNARRGY